MFCANIGSIPILTKSSTLHISPAIQTDAVWSCVRRSRTLPLLARPRARILSAPSLDSSCTKAQLNDLLALHIPTLTEPAPPFPTTARRAAEQNGCGPASQMPPLRADATTSASGTISHAAARGYNQLVFEGQLAEDPTLRQAGTGRLYCCVTILQDQSDRNGQPGAQAVDVVCFDERAARFARRILG